MAGKESSGSGGGGGWGGGRLSSRPLCHTVLGVALATRLNQTPWEVEGPPGYTSVSLAVIERADNQDYRDGATPSMFILFPI